MSSLWIFPSRSKKIKNKKELYLWLIFSNVLILLGFVILAVGIAMAASLIGKIFCAISVPIVGFSFMAYFNICKKWDKQIKDDFIKKQDQTDEYLYEIKEIMCFGGKTKATSEATQFTSNGYEIIAIEKMRYYLFKPKYLVLLRKKR